MFTGIVQEAGRVTALTKTESGARLSVECRQVLDDAQIGSSFAVNGACLTAVELTERGFVADLAPETLSRTNLGALRPGSLVNLERPLAANGRLDGHFVLGHVDRTATLTSLRALGEGNWWLELRLPADLGPLRRKQRFGSRGWRQFDRGLD